MQNQQPRAYYSDQIKQCDYVLRLNKSRYDVGFRRENDGTYKMEMDLWAGQIACQLGDNRAQGESRPVAKFLQAYTRCAAIESAVDSGYMIESINEQADGTLVINVDTGA